MFKTKFFINGIQVTETEAKQHWLRSSTYAKANKKTRDSIWHVALRGNSDGNHNPGGEVNHLKEAGVTLAHNYKYAYQWPCYNTYSQAANRIFVLRSKALGKIVLKAVCMLGR